ncbi:hypothetical protein PUR34_41445 [Streptomyces sp. JV185]|uniref:hypothetical protein n=1 Tax=Streptomyces sp. JV185 TaxID=858638 RepID=UPI002E7935A2|nr:hypothetical protein [Streptomyces sp. JV185]MEE1774470.1 hypothetical protein [Streptomyces sp. JV185]
MSKAIRRVQRAHRRAARAVLRDRTRANRPHSLASHIVARGESAETAKSISAGLRTAAKRLGLTGKAGRTRRTVDGRGRLRRVVRYTTTQFAAALQAYRPRKQAFVSARARLLAGVAA